MTTVDGPLIGKVPERLDDDEIHVWRLPYRRDAGRAPFLRLLAAYLDRPASTIALVADTFGRPALVDVHGIGFNWTHSGDCALFAIGKDIQPGIDVEWRRERPRAIEIAERYFDAEETAYLTALPIEARSHAFLELWTAKEAVLKALGRGLAFGLHRLRIDKRDDRLHLERLDGEDVRQWQLHRLLPDNAHLGALAWRGDVRQIRYRTLAAPP